MEQTPRAAAGTSLWLGVLPSTDADADADFDRARLTIRRLGLTLGLAASERVVPTPACGLAGATPDYVRTVLRLLRDVGRELVDPVER